MNGAALRSCLPGAPGCSPHPFLPPSLPSVPGGPRPPFFRIRKRKGAMAETFQPRAHRLSAPTSSRHSACCKARDPWSLAPGSVVWTGEERMWHPITMRTCAIPACSTETKHPRHTQRDWATDTGKSFSNEVTRWRPRPLLAWVVL